MLAATLSTHTLFAFCCILPAVACNIWRQCLFLERRVKKLEHQTTAYVYALLSEVYNLVYLLKPRRFPNCICVSPCLSSLLSVNYTAAKQPILLKVSSPLINPCWVCVASVSTMHGVILYGIGNDRSLRISFPTRTVSSAFIWAAKASHKTCR